ncbi:MAG: hypothetical protein NTX50_16975 [Candidatus Sumerlaeota bacterium]|nr:hypothetical protein [Candidatus Sumerlaeota bacterium]
MKTINAIAEIDTEGWLKVNAPSNLPPGAWEAVIVLSSPSDAQTSTSMNANQPSSEMSAVDCLRKIAESGGIDIQDPVAWQKDIRKDRLLPGRE